LAGAMGMVLPIASEFGVSFDQVGAAFAGMTRTGTNARVAATQLKAILSAMASPSKQASDAMAEFGINAETFRRTVREQGLIKALVDLRTAVGDNEQGLAEIFPNLRALMGTLDLLGANMQYNIKIFDALANAGGSLERAFSEIEGTTQQKLNVALATFKTTLISIGEVMKPFVVNVLAKLNDKLAEVTGSFQSMTEHQRRVKLITLVVTAAFGPFLLVISKAIQMALSLKVALAGVLGPYGLLLAALTAVSLGIARSISKQNEALRVYERSQKVIDDLNVSVATESMRLSTLTSRLNAATKGSEEWNIIKDKINSTYGQYLENLLSEKMTTEELTEAMEQLTAARVRDMRVQGMKKEVDRLMEENATQYAEGMRKFQKVIQKGEAELISRGKAFPMMEFTTAMTESIDKAVSVMADGGNYVDDVRAIGEKMYAEWFFGITKGTMSPSAKHDFLQEFYNLTSGKINMNKAMAPLEAGIASFEMEDKEVNVGLKLKRVDEQIVSTKEAEKTEGRRTTLITLIGLEKEKNLLLDKDAAELNKANLQAYEAELEQLNKIASSLGVEASKEAEIEKYKKERAKLTGAELEANSKKIRQAEAELKTLQLETSGLSEIEKVRGRIEIMRDKGLTLDGAALEASNKKIAQEQIGLRLIELEASGLSDIEKSKERIQILNEASRYMSEEELKIQTETARLAEQTTRTKELQIAGAGRLLMLEDELKRLQENQQFMNTGDAAVQQEKIDAKNEEIAVEKENIAGLGEIAQLENEIGRLIAESGKYVGDRLGLHKQEILAEQARLYELKKQKGELTAIEALELDIARAKALALQATDPAAAAAILAEIDALEQKKAALGGDLFAPMQFKQEGTKEWFKGMNEVITSIRAAQAIFKEKNGVESEDLAKQEQETLDMRRDGWLNYYNTILQAASAFASGMSNLIEAQKQRELSAAGDNAKQREAIEKKYYLKQKKWAIAQALINTALAIGSALQTQPFLPMGPIAAALAAIAGGVQVAAVRAQSFAKGGVVYGETLARVGEYPGASSNPEVIAPLSDLKALLGGTRGGIPKTIELKVKGRDLWAVINMEQNLQNTY